MALGDKNQLLGFWIFIKDEASARWALKMSGVVFLISSFGHLIGALLFFLASDTFLGAFCLVMIPLLILVSFKLRNGNNKLLPIFTAYLFLISAINVIAYFMNPGSIAFASLCLNLLCSFLVLSGLRGWLWLKKHSLS
jgi:hypothetical protein